MGRQIISSVVQQKLNFSVLLSIMVVHQIQINLEFFYCHFQVMILTFKRLIFFHQNSQLVLQILETSNPLFINDWSIYVNWHLNLDWHLDFYFLFNLYRSIYINRFLNVDGLVDNDRIFVYWPFHEYLLLDDFWHFYLFYNDLWNFLLDLNIFGYLDNLLYYPFRTKYVSGNLYFHFHRLFHHKLFNSLFGYHLVVLLYPFFKILNFHFQPVFLSLEFIYSLLMIFAGEVFPTQMIKLQLQPNSFLFAFCQMLGQSMYFLEQFFEALLILPVIIDKYLYFFIFGSVLSCGGLHSIHLFFSGRECDWNKSFDIFQIADLSLWKVFVDTD